MPKIDAVVERSNQRKQEWMQKANELLGLGPPLNVWAECRTDEEAKILKFFDTVTKIFHPVYDDYSTEEAQVLVATTLRNERAKMAPFDVHQAAQKASNWIDYDPETLVHALNKLETEKHCVECNAPGTDGGSRFRLRGTVAFSCADCCACFKRTRNPNLKLKFLDESTQLWQ